ncbi:MAG: tetratricopeptide repeat protein [Deltaproteobacteria bacterium]|nr:tetratricopeptide repeat protein [Deltaproteobacteria bacterium]
MAGSYGVSFAARAITAGNFPEAIVQATAAIQRDDTDPEAWFERATAYAWMDRNLEAVSDFEHAIELDTEAGILETDAVDDAFFSALLAAAQKEASIIDGVKHLERYTAVVPKGRHVQDAVDWARRLRGELKSTFIKHPGVEGND